MLEFHSNRIGGHATAQRERSEDTYCTEQVHGWDRLPCHYSRASSGNQRLTTFAATKTPFSHSNAFSRGKQCLLPMTSISLETFSSMSRRSLLSRSFKAIMTSRYAKPSLKKILLSETLIFGGVRSTLAYNRKYLHITLTQSYVCNAHTYDSDGKTKPGVSGI